MRTVFVIAIAWVGLWLAAGATIWVRAAHSMPPALHPETMSYWQSIDDVMFSNAVSIRDGNCYIVRDYLDGDLMEIGCKYMTWKN